MAFNCLIKWHCRELSIQNVSGISKGVYIYMWGCWLGKTPLISKRLGGFHVFRAESIKGPFLMSDLKIS